MNDLLPSQWQGASAFILHIVLEFLLMLYWLGRNEQRNWNSCFLRNRSQTYEVVSVAIIKRQDKSWRIYSAAVEQVGGLGQTNDSIVLLEKANMLPKSLCRHSHAVRTIRHKMMRENHDRVLTPESAIPVSTSNNGRAK